MARRIWVTADTHFGDEAAIATFSRPFADARAMDEALLDAINRRVRRRDTLLHLGDLFGALDWASRGRRRDARRFLRRIRCRRVALVRGNQDPRARGFARLFRECEDLASLRVPDPADSARRLRVVCCHYPLLQWQGMWKGALHLHGHSHGSLREEGRRTDVGVDCWEFAPVPLERVVEMLAARPVPKGVFVRAQPQRAAQPPL
ncbi:MAG: metallophosphoesterase [Phycisphaerales bacterium]